MPLKAKPIVVIGLGADLKPPAESLDILKRAALVFGSARQLRALDSIVATSTTAKPATKPPAKPKRRLYPKPLAALFDNPAWPSLDAHEPLVFLASGDPSWFGIAKLIVAHFGIENVDVRPVPGAFSHAAARLGWSLENCHALSMHSDDGALPATPYPKARWLVLCRDGATPLKLARLLDNIELGESTLHVLSALGSQSERQTHTSARALAQNPTRFEALSVIAAQLPERAPFMPITALSDACMKGARSGS